MIPKNTLVSQIKLVQLKGGFVKIIYTSKFGYEYTGTYQASLTYAIKLIPPYNVMQQHLKLQELATRSHVYKINAASHIDINRDCLANLRIIKYAKQPLQNRRYTVLFQNGFDVHYSTWNGAFARMKVSAIQCVIYDTDTGTVWAAKKYVHNSRK